MIRSLRIECSVTVERGVSRTCLILAVRRFHLPTMNLDLRSPTRLHRIIATNQGAHLRPIIPRSIPFAMLRALQRQPMNLSTLPRLLLGLPLATPLCRLPLLPLTLPFPSSAFSLPLAPDVVSYGGVVYVLRGGVLDRGADESTDDECDDHNDNDGCA